jgi:putative flavoprotein involved in K+ transport
VNTTGITQQFPEPHRYEPTDVKPEARLSLDLVDAGVGSVIWATGYRRAYPWLRVPVFDTRGASGTFFLGVVAAPGLYVMGLPFMRRRKSSFIDGAGDDAADLAAHLSQNLDRAAA